ncbi:hypothetical protein Forpe1208_v013962 [Fusarium oxysporum f. sp. rapae]|uniref:Uncharacterized protein n=1 Tax=Fusarium oxysporum f. sp. rapae TaxID=485398 RepID=A0A8J5NML6_FUSOX|nr:hypothetical protein Forpe1208_v013962 [Fusarium oxysporum f. sp. rapae]
MRHPNGRLAWVLLQNFASWKSYEHQRCQQLSDVKDIFAKIWIELFKNPDAESVASYKPRYSTEELHFNLAIVPGSSVGILKPQIDGSQTKAIKFLEDTIVAVNKPKGKSKSNSKKAQVKPPTDLKLKKGTKPKEVDDKPRMKLELKTAAAIAYDYIKIGENPLGLFSTYIKLDDFNKYMKTLEAPRVELLSKQARINAARKAPSTSESKEMEDANVNDCIMKSGQLSVRQKAGQEKVTIENHKTTLVVPISCLKIQEALGQRAAKNAPGRVMGMSASVCAEAYLGWDKLPYNDTEKSRGMMLRNGLYMAEWLHLSAFSWGGLLGLPRSNVSNPPQHETSDVPENLVLGTSETNSQMTRFEKAWQALVRDETILTDNPDFSAVLKVIRNPDQIGIIPHDERKATGNCHYVQGKTTLTEDHRKTAKEFKFVAYAVHYCIKFPTGCRLLRLEAGKELSTEFYPFLRPLYHKLEADLDRLLYDQLKEIWDTDAEGPDLANKLQAQTNNTNPFSSPMRTNNPNLMWQGSNAGLLSSNPYFNTPLLNNTLPYFLSGLTIGCPLDEEKGPGKKLMG